MSGAQDKPGIGEMYDSWHNTAIEPAAVRVWQSRPAEVLANDCRGLMRPRKQGQADFSTRPANDTEKTCRAFRILLHPGMDPYEHVWEASRSIIDAMYADWLVIGSHGATSA